jgi:hypothetical protein
MLEILRTFFDHWVVSPIRSGIGSYRTREQAITEAREWGPSAKDILSMFLKSPDPKSSQCQTAQRGEGSSGLRVALFHAPTHCLAGAAVLRWWHARPRFAWSIAPHPK